MIEDIRASLKSTSVALIRLQVASSFTGHRQSNELIDIIVGWRLRTLFSGLLFLWVGLGLFILLKFRVLRESESLSELHS